MIPKLENKVVIVTGAGSGIGRASALKFAEEGTKVVVVDIDVQGGKETVRMVKGAGGEAIFVKTDVSNATEVELMVKKTIESYGRLDCAHNNAGIESSMKLMVDCTEAEWDRCINVNLKSVWLCMKYEIPQMLRVGKGAIVNTSSIAGLVGASKRSEYVTSKHGVIGLTKAVALDYAMQGIRVNAICPGLTLTAMVERIWQARPETKLRSQEAVPVGRAGRPEEVAKAVVWLCSDATQFITGHALVIDGGSILGYF